MIAGIDRPGRFFSWGELVRSETARTRGIDNTPGPAEAARLVALCLVLDAIREELGPLTVTSGYRSHALNVLIGGSARSAHVRGEAADVKGGGGWDATVALDKIQALGLPVDQVIAYHPDRGGHLHIGIVVGGEPRRQYLWAPPSGGFVEA